VTWSNGDILATVSRSGVFIERAGLKLLDPGPVQLARNVVAFRETAERHARNEFLGDLPFVFDAMRTVPGYGFRPLKARQSISNLQMSTVRAHSTSRIISPPPAECPYDRRHNAGMVSGRMRYSWR